MTGVLTEVGAMIVGLDQLAADLLVSIRDPAITKVMNSVTGLGSATAAGVVVGLFYLGDWHEEVATSVLALGLTGPVVLMLMGLVQRPFPANPVCVTSGEMVAHSFPSGHAASVTVFALLAARSERLPLAPTAVLAAMIALSRMYLGTHYLSDTLAGIGIGAAAFLVATRWLTDSRQAIVTYIQNR
ncbi:phosphatase PAP2 family protein [Halonotius sp. GCM10025705]|uniref:phosphatase PAP2 family protein n=1 Tax=Halonotius sp. GCM10025705 TaxID=3252678 RepID=UPI00361AAA6D